MWFRNLSVYKLNDYKFDKIELEKNLAARSFAPCSSSEYERVGWASHRNDGQFAYQLNGQLLLALRTETKIMPAASINEIAKVRIAEMEEAQGFMPGKKAIKELKERIADELLPRALSRHAMTFVWIDTVNGWLVVDASSGAKADHAVKALLKSIDKLPLESLRVQRSPAAVMTAWLEMDEAPAGFTVDQDCTLQATGQSRAVVSYKRHTLEVDDIRRHIATGKQCMRLSMTWRDRISFTLGDDLTIRAVHPLDIIKENDATVRNDIERFDNDFMLMSAEFNKMLGDIVLALGGEAQA